MNCMKCGREIPLGQVFCKECLGNMEAHPVAPGTPVQLPVHKPETAPKRQNTRKTRKPEEQIIRLRRWVRGLLIALLAVILASAVAISVLLHLVLQERNTPLPGQNFSTVEET